MILEIIQSYSRPINLKLLAIGQTQNLPHHDFIQFPAVRLDLIQGDILLYPLWLCELAKFAKSDWSD